MLNAFLVALAVFICVGGAELVGFTMLNRPIVIGPLVGLFLGDLHTGVIIGASLEAVFMGVVNIGGASAAEPGIATAVGTAFAIMLGKGSEVALTLALPIGILGLQIKTVLYIFIVGMFAKTFDRLAAEGKEKQIVALHYGLWAVNWFLYSLFAFFGILFGSDAVSALLDAIPDVVMNGLTVCGGLLPAVGMAMLMKMLWDNKICMFYFLGFVLAAYLKLPLIALAVIGVIIAISIGMNDYRLNQLAAQRVTASPAGGSDQYLDDTGLCSVLGLMAKTLLIDKSIERMKLNKYFTIISSKPDEICEFIMNGLDRSATVYHGEGVYSHKDKKIILTVVDVRQAVLLQRFIDEVDPQAFLMVTKSSEVVGKGFMSYI